MELSLYNLDKLNHFKYELSNLLLNREKVTSQKMSHTLVQL